MFPRERNCKSSDILGGGLNLCENCKSGRGELGWRINPQRRRSSTLPTSTHGFPCAATNI